MNIYYFLIASILSNILTLIFLISYVMKNSNLKEELFEAKKDIKAYERIFGNSEKLELTWEKKVNE